MSVENLIERLRGIYRVPITDGLGAVGSGEEPDNPNEFVRKFETPPIQHEAADKLEQQQEVLKAAKALTDWCYGEVGADIDLTPGLRALCEYFGGYDVG